MGAVQGDSKDGDDITRPNSQTKYADPEKKINNEESEHESQEEQVESNVDSLSHHDEELGETGRDDNDDEDQNPEDPTIDATANPARRPSRAQSRTSSTRSRALTIVPRSKRRGLFAQFCIIPEVERPYDYSRKTKWTITLIVALAAAGGPLGSNLLYRKYFVQFSLATRLFKV